MIQQITAKCQTKLCKEPKDFIGGAVVCGEKWGVDQVIGSALGGKWLQLRLSYASGDWWILANHWELAELEPSEPKRQRDGAKDQRPHLNATRGQINATQLVYYTQQNNKDSPERTCFSTSCAMLLKYYLPESIQSDDEYVEKVFSIGDTTEASTQLQALRSYGLNPKFAKNWTLDMLKDRVNEQPIAIGICHRSNYLTPKGGHWVVVSNWNPATKMFTVQDPYQSDYNWQDGVYDSVAPGKDQLWPDIALHYRYTVEAKDGHPHSGFSLWIESD